MATLPIRLPSANRTLSITGGENMMRLAELYLGDATQWWRISDLNNFPGEAPDFFISPADAQRLNYTLQIPSANPNATWP